jgi:hypothetical protein
MNLLSCSRNGNSLPNRAGGERRERPVDSRAKNLGAPKNAPWSEKFARARFEPRLALPGVDRHAGFLFPPRKAL